MDSTLDCYLGIANMPFKMTVDAMLKVAYWTQNQPSYQRAENKVKQPSKVEGCFM